MTRWTSRTTTWSARWSQRRLAQTVRFTLEPDGFNVLNACRTAAWQTVLTTTYTLHPAIRRRPARRCRGPHGAPEDEIAAIADRIRGEGARRMTDTQTIRWSETATWLRSSSPTRR